MGFKTAGKSSKFLQAAAKWQANQQKGGGRGFGKGGGGGSGGYGQSANTYARNAQSMMAHRAETAVEDALKKESKCKEKLSKLKEEGKAAKRSSKTTVAALVAANQIDASLSKKVEKSVAAAGAAERLAKIKTKKEELKKLRKKRRKTQRRAGVYPSSSDSSSSDTSDSSDSSSDSSDSSDDSSDDGDSAKKKKKKKARKKKAKKKQTKQLAKAVKERDAALNDQLIALGLVTDAQVAALDDEEDTGARRATLPRDSEERVKKTSAMAVARIRADEIARLADKGLLKGRALRDALRSIASDDEDEDEDADDEEEDEEGERLARLAAKRTQSAARKKRLHLVAKKVPATPRRSAKTQAGMDKLAGASAKRAKQASKKAKAQLAAMAEVAEEEVEEEWEDQDEPSGYEMDGDESLLYEAANNARPSREAKEFAAELYPYDLDGLLNGLGEMSDKQLAREYWCEFGLMDVLIEGTKGEKAKARKQVTKALTAHHHKCATFTRGMMYSCEGDYGGRSMQWADLWNEMQAGKGERAEARKTTRARKAAVASAFKAPKPKATPRPKATSKCGAGHTNKAAAERCSRSGCESPIVVDGKRGSAKKAKKTTAGGGTKRRRRAACEEHDVEEVAPAAGDQSMGDLRDELVFGVVTEAELCLEEDDGEGYALSALKREYRRLHTDVLLDGEITADSFELGAKEVCEQYNMIGQEIKRRQRRAKTAASEKRTATAEGSASEEDGEGAELEEDEHGGMEAEADGDEEDNGEEEGGETEASPGKVKRSRRIAKAAGRGSDDEEEEEGEEEEESARRDSTIGGGRRKTPAGEP